MSRFSWKQLSKPFMVLAPMEDVTDSVFRRIVASCARPDVFFTEFTSVNGLFSKGRDEVIKRFAFTSDEHPIIAQVWGTEPELFRQAAELICTLGFDGMDINFGCPEKSVTSHGAGACLITDHELAAKIIAAAREGLAGRIPLSVKTRIGFKTVDPSWLPFLIAQQLDALTIHGRTAKELSKVPNHWDEIAKAVRVRTGDTVIIGNGDVKNYADGVKKCAQFGVDGVMIGRGVFSDLWAFDKQGMSHMNNQRILFSILQKHLELYEETGKNYAVLKKYFKIYVQGFAHAKEIREQLMNTTTPSQAKDILLSFNTAK